MIAQRIVKGLFSLCMVYIFVLVGTNMFRYGQETGFASDKEMVTSALNRVTADRHVEDDAFVYLTGIQHANEDANSYIVELNDFLDDIWQFMASFTEALTIISGFSVGMVALFQQWGLSLRMGIIEHGLFVSEYILS